MLGKLAVFVDPMVVAVPQHVPIRVSLNLTKDGAIVIGLEEVGGGTPIVVGVAATLVPRPPVVVHLEAG